MTIGGGLGATLGLGVEGTYGTLATPTRWIPMSSESLDYQVMTAQGEGLSGSGGPHLAAQRVVTAYNVAGTFQVPMATRGIGALIAHLLGNAPASTQVGSTPAYTQTYTGSTSSDLHGKSLTLQVRRPDTAGTVHPFTFLGCKVVSGVFECDSSGIAMATFGFNGRDVDTATAATSPTFTGNTTHNWPGLSISAGTTIGSETALAGIRKVTVTVTNGVEDAYYAGGLGKKSEPVQNARPVYTVALDADYVSDTLAGYYRAQTPVSLIVDWLHQTAISGSTYPELKFSLPYAVADSGSPQVGGPGIIQPTFTFNGLDDASHTPLTAVYVSQETTPA